MVSVSYASVAMNSRLLLCLLGLIGLLSLPARAQIAAVASPSGPVPAGPYAVVDVATGEASGAHHQRSDVCAVPAAGVVAEAMVALVLAEAVLEKFGGDSVAETRRNLDAYLASIPDALRTAGA